MELTIDKLKNSSSEQIFYLFTDLFLKIYNEYCSLKLSRSDFKIYITNIIEIIKHDIDKINIDDYKNSIEEYIEKRVRESLDDYKLNRTGIKKDKPKKAKTSKEVKEKSKTTTTKKNNLINKKLIKDYLKTINLSSKIGNLISILNGLEKFLTDNKIEIDSSIYCFLIEKSKVIYNIVERITEIDLDTIRKKYEISQFIINLVEYYFEYNAASYEVELDELDNYDSVKIYLKELPSKLLTKEEEQELFIKYRNGDDSAREELINCNLRLVVSIAKKYVYSELPFLEVISEGNIGLMTAVEKFNSDYGLKFSTYATWWIRQAIKRAIADKSRIVRIPVHVHEKLYKLKKVQDKLNIDYGRPASIDEIAEYMNEKPSYIEKLMKYMTPTLSLNAPLQTGSHRQEDSESEMGYFIESEVESPIEATERSRSIKFKIWKS
jgi:RNA polymerase primary sigma factor